MSKVTYTDAKQTVMTAKDGSVWACSVDSRGFMTINYCISRPAVPEKVESKMPTFPELTKDEGKTEVGSGKSTSTIEKEVEDKKKSTDVKELAKMTDNVFKERLSSIMTDNMFDRRIRGSKRGKLDMLRLWKAEAGAKNIFQKKSARKNKEYNIVLLVDESGSMMDKWNNGVITKTSRIDVASEIAVFLGKSFEGLNLNLAIVGFNQLFTIHKGFDEKVEDYGVLRKTMIDNTASYAGAHNNDFDALSNAYKLFKGRTGKNLLFMLSDGAPATGYEVTEVLRKKNPKKYLDDKIKERKMYYWRKDGMGKESTLCIDLDRKLGDESKRDDREQIRAVVNDYKSTVDSFGIGIQTECWQIPDNVKVENLEQLKPAILKELKSKIRRG